MSKVLSCTTFLAGLGQLSSLELLIFLFDFKSVCHISLSVMLILLEYTNSRTIPIMINQGISMITTNVLSLVISFVLGHTVYALFFFFLLKLFVPFSVFHNECSYVTHIGTIWARNVLTGRALRTRTKHGIIIISMTL